jgi:peptide chain release factor subunit 1
MQRNDITETRLRRLAETHLDEGKVLSAYLGLPPSEFGTRPARASAIRSLLDEAARTVREADDLGHRDREHLAADVERLEAFFGEEFSASETHGVAVFSATAADLFEVVRLPAAVEPQIVIGDAPFIEPLIRMGERERWAVLLVSRADARVLRGSQSGLSEVRVLDEDVHGQHSAGGWSQARYQRSVDEEADRHIRRAVEALQQSHRRMPFDQLLISAGDEVFATVELLLDDELRRRLAGRFACDASDATEQDVLEAARPVMLEAAARRERELLDRLADSLGAGAPASAELPGVLDALVQRRVGTLLLDETFAAPGSECPECGWLGPPGERCPVDGTPLAQHPDVTERAVEAALQQSADAVFVHHHPDLRELGGIASLNRF